MKTDFKKSIAVVLCLSGVSAAPAALAQTSPHHNSVAVVIGNAKYAHTTEVPFAHNDARAMRDYLTKKLGFRADNVLLELDMTRERMETMFGEPDRPDGELVDRLNDWPLARRGDVFIFYSGHGVPDPDAIHDDGRRAFLLPSDVNLSRIAQAAFSIDRLQRKLDLVRGQLPSDRKVVLMMDACFSGRTPPPLRKENNTVAASSSDDQSIFRNSRGSFKVQLDKPAADFVRLVAATGDQAAYWNTQAKQGLFTSLFLQAVNGAADGKDFGNGDGYVSGKELEDFLTERLPQEARRRQRATQRPDLSNIQRFNWVAPKPEPNVTQTKALLSSSQSGVGQEQINAILATNAALKNAPVSSIATPTASPQAAKAASGKAESLPRKKISQPRKRQVSTASATSELTVRTSAKKRNSSLARKSESRQGNCFTFQSRRYCQ